MNETTKDPRIPTRGEPYKPREDAANRAYVPLPPMRLTGGLPRLTTDQKAELRTAAPALLRCARDVNALVNRLATMNPSGFWQASLLVAASGISLIGSGVATVGAVLAFAACDDGAEDPLDPASIEAWNAAQERFKAFQADVDRKLAETHSAAEGV